VIGKWEVGRWWGSGKVIGRWEGGREVKRQRKHSRKLRRRWEGGREVGLL